MTHITSSDIEVFTPKSDPLGTSYKDWCKKWCEWVVSIPKQVNPTGDATGGYATQAQNVPEVLFLCQTFESSRSIPNRKVMITNGTNIFMPIINWISVLGGAERNEDDLKKLAKEMMDEVVKLQIFINGQLLPVDLAGFRFQSPILHLVLPIENIFDLKHGPTTLVVDGFWIFFRPLVRHLTLETYGACRSGRTQIAVKYELDSYG